MASSAYRTGRKLKIHQSHVFGESKADIRSPAKSEPRFYIVNTCIGCRGEVLEAAVGLYIDDKLYGECSAVSVPYPVHDKLVAISTKSQAIGEFLEWLNQSQEIVLAEWPDNSRANESRKLYGELHQTHRTIDDLLAAYFEIDLKELEMEKKVMLALIRSKDVEQL